MLSEAEPSAREDHFAPSVRVVDVELPPVMAVGDNQPETFGFHLTRGKWDPYPWVSKIDAGSPADVAGVRAGDCVLEVNAEDCIGKRISEIAQSVKRARSVCLLLWNAGVDAQCSPETLCCGPMPNNFQRLSACMSAILSCLECPICLDTTQPPVYQCDNGHIICLKCRAKSERCPVCRVRFERGRSLLADNVHNAITDAFDLRHVSKDARTIRMQQIFKPQKAGALPDIKVSQAHHNKFLARLIGKASSVENLSSKSTAAISNGRSNQLAVDAEFVTNLRVKSLSSSEIFKTGQAPGMSGGSSMDSLATDQKDATMYRCPFAEDCAGTFRMGQIYQHFQNAHDGPLIQYFKAAMSVPLGQEGTYLMIHDERHFILKILHEDGHGVRIWMWLVGSKELAGDYQVQFDLHRKPTPTEYILSLRTPVYSLQSVTWHDLLYASPSKSTYVNAALGTNDLQLSIRIANLN